MWMRDTEASITEGFTHGSNSVSRWKHKKKEITPLTITTTCTGAMKSVLKSGPPVLHPYLKCLFFCEPTWNLHIWSCQTTDVGPKLPAKFWIREWKGAGGKKRQQKLLCAAKKYHCKILVFIARRCLPSVAESAFFSLHSTSTHTEFESEHKVCCEETNSTTQTAPSFAQNGNYSRQRSSRLSLPLHGFFSPSRSQNWQLSSRISLINLNHILFSLFLK